MRKSGYAGDIPVGSVGSSGLPVLPCQLEQPQSVRGGQPGTDVMGAKSVCKGDRTQSRFLQDSTNSRLFPSVFLSGDFGAGNKALQVQTPQALLRYRKKAVRVWLCKALAAVALCAVQRIRRALWHGLKTSLATSAASWFLSITNQRNHVNLRHRTTACYESSPACCSSSTEFSHYLSAWYEAV